MTDFCKHFFVIKIANAIFVTLFYKNVLVVKIANTIFMTDFGVLITKARVTFRQAISFWLVAE